MGISVDQYIICSSPKNICVTVVGRNPAPVEVGSLSHYLQGLGYIQTVVGGWDFWTITVRTWTWCQASCHCVWDCEIDLDLGTEVFWISYLTKNTASMKRVWSGSWTNPCEKYARQIGSWNPKDRGENEKCLKPPQTILSKQFTYIAAEKYWFFEKKIAS